MSATARAKFAEELKAHRERMGLLQAQLAYNAGISLSLLKKIEQGKRRAQVDFAAWCDEFFGCPGTFARFQELTLLEQFSEWLASRIPFEEKADSITEYEMRVVPGLLQTRAYAEAIIRNDRPFTTEAERTRDIEGRMERQEILRCARPPNLWVLLAEGPLRQVVGGSAVMRDQLGHLITMTDSPKCMIQVVPFSATDAPAPSGAATLFEFADRPPVAYLEGWDAGWVVEAAGKVTDISTRISMIKGCALSPAESRNLLIKIREEL